MAHANENDDDSIGGGPLVEIFSIYASRRVLLGVYSHASPLFRESELGTSSEGVCCLTTRVIWCCFITRVIKTVLYYHPCDTISPGDTVCYFITRVIRCVALSPE